MRRHGFARLQESLLHFLMYFLDVQIFLEITLCFLGIISIWRGGAVDNVQMEVRRLSLATHKRKPTRARPDSDDPGFSCLLLGWLKAQYCELKAKRGKERTESSKSGIMSERKKRRNFLVYI